MTAIQAARDPFVTALRSDPGAGTAVPDEGDPTPPAIDRSFGEHLDAAARSPETTEAPAERGAAVAPADGATGDSPPVARRGAGRGRGRPGPGNAAAEVGGTDGAPASAQAAGVAVSSPPIEIRGAGEPITESAAAPGAAQVRVITAVGAVGLAGTAGSRSATPATPATAAAPATPAATTAAPATPASAAPPATPATPATAAATPDATGGAAGDAERDRGGMGGIHEAVGRTEAPSRMAPRSAPPPDVPPEPARSGRAVGERDATLPVADPAGASAPSTTVPPPPMTAGAAGADATVGSTAEGAATSAPAADPASADRLLDRVILHIRTVAGAGGAPALEARIHDPELGTVHLRVAGQLGEVVRAELVVADQRIADALARAADRSPAHGLTGIELRITAQSPAFDAGGTGSGSASGAGGRTLDANGWAGSGGSAGFGAGGDLAREDRGRGQPSATGETLHPRPPAVRRGLAGRSLDVRA